MAKAVSLKKGIPPFSQQEYELLLRLYVKQGWTAEDVAERFKVGLRTLYLRLKAHGISKTGASAAKLKYCGHCGQALPKR